MRLALLASFAVLIAACDDAPNRLTGLGTREPGDTIGVPGDTTGVPGDTTGLPGDTITPVDTVRSAADAAAFVLEAAATLIAYSDPDDAFATFQLAGGAGARGAIQPPADSLPVQTCQNPRDPYFYAREHRGITYAWRVDADSYAWSTEPGARSCSIRIVRYVLDAGSPVVPLERIGYIEVTDRYAPGPNSGIDFVVVDETDAGPNTVTSYTSNRSYEYYSRAYREDWTLHGFFDRGGDRFDFSFNQITSSSYSPGASYYNVSGSSRFSGGGIELTTSRSPDGVTVVVRRGDRTVRLVIARSSAAEPFSGEIRTEGFAYDGVVGTISGPPDDPTFLDNTGGALPASVEADLEQFWSAVGDMLGLHRWPHV